jgi:hypothetical protein
VQPHDHSAGPAAAAALGKEHQSKVQMDSVRPIAALLLLVMEACAVYCCSQELLTMNTESSPMPDTCVAYKIMGTCNQHSQLIQMQVVLRITAGYNNTLQIH